MPVVRGSDIFSSTTTGRRRYTWYQAVFPSPANGANLSLSQDYLCLKDAFLGGGQGQGQVDAQESDAVGQEDVDDLPF